MNELTRRQIRYICFRIQTEEAGGFQLDSEGFLSSAPELKAHLEGQEDFGGWDKFAKTWDVDEKAPLVAVLRTSSIASDWNKEVEKTAKDVAVVTKKGRKSKVKIADAYNIDGK